MSVVVWWKRHYGYSSTDPLFKNATLTEILEDAAEQDAINYIREYESYDKETNDFAKRRVLDPNADEDEMKKIAEQLNRAMGVKP
jgi:hypothetical protein